MAKHDLGPEQGNISTFKILQKMPHESLAAHVDDLWRVIEDATGTMGCENLECPSDVKRTVAVPGRLAEIFNGAGPGAAEYLDRIYAANLKSSGNGLEPIGGLTDVASCIGKVSPEIETAIARWAYKDTHRPGDINFTFRSERSLKNSGQSEKARRYIEGKLAEMIAKSENPEMKPNSYGAQEMKKSIERAGKILESRTDQKPYCPARSSPH